MWLPWKPNQDRGGGVDEGRWGIADMDVDVTHNDLPLDNLWNWKCQGTRPVWGYVLLQSRQRKINLERNRNVSHYENLQSWDKHLSFKLINIEQFLCTLPCLSETVMPTAAFSSTGPFNMQSTKSKPSFCRDLRTELVLCESCLSPCW